MWIARDSKALTPWDEKPELWDNSEYGYEPCWMHNEDNPFTRHIELPYEWFPEVTLDNSPIEVELKIKEK